MNLKTKTSKDIPSLILRPSPVESDISEVRDVIKLDAFNYDEWISGRSLQELKESFN